MCVGHKAVRVLGQQRGISAISGDSGTGVPALLPQLFLLAEHPPLLRGSPQHPPDARRSPGLVGATRAVFSVVVSEHGTVH